MNLFDFNQTELLAFALVLLRMIGFIIAMPVIGMDSVPISAKILLSFTLTFILFPQVGWQKLAIDIESMQLMTMVVRELFLGLCFGFIARLFFLTIGMAAQIISVSLGLAAAQLLDPNMGESSTAIDQFYIVLATVFFLAINGHHLLIDGVFKSFELVPMATTGLKETVFLNFGETVQAVSVIALKMSAPLLATILFMNLSIAIMGRAVPQINILITSLPVNILSGFLVLFLTLPLLIWQMSELLDTTTEELMMFFKNI